MEKGGVFAAEKLDEAVKARGVGRREEVEIDTAIEAGDEEFAVGIVDKCVCSTEQLGHGFLVAREVVLNRDRGLVVTNAEIVVLFWREHAEFR